MKQALVTLTVQQLDSVIQYLGKRPYEETFRLIAMLFNAAKNSGVEQNEVKNEIQNSGVHKKQRSNIGKRGRPRKIQRIQEHINQPRSQ